MDIDIGKEKPAIVVEPVEDPFPARQPEPAPKETPVPQEEPVKV